jgi:hypothetical protein
MTARANDNAIRGAVTAAFIVAGIALSVRIIIAGCVWLGPRVCHLWRIAL